VITIGTPIVITIATRIPTGIIITTQIARSIQEEAQAAVVLAVVGLLAADVLQVAAVLVDIVERISPLNLYFIGSTL
ncbi:MAG: hypothetical protein K2I16_04825, partial [Muribaculaceae bacterium]|nr:hypothetical protein [Muribaculaceae bacterium]